MRSRPTNCSSNSSNSNSNTNKPLANLSSALPPSSSRLLNKKRRQQGKRRRPSQRHNSPQNRRPERFCSEGRTRLEQSSRASCRHNQLTTSCRRRKPVSRAWKGNSASSSSTDIFALDMEQTARADSRLHFKLRAQTLSTV